MLSRTKYFIGGLLVALTVGAIAQTGGLPSRPRFLSVGVGTAAPSTNGNMAVTGTITAGNFSAGTSGQLTARVYNVTDGTRVGFLQADGGGISIGAQSNHPVSFYQNGGIECRINTPTAGMDCIDGFQSNGGAASFPLGVNVSTAATLPAATTINAQSVCLANGTNCPSAGVAAPIICNTGPCSLTGIAIGQSAHLSNQNLETKTSVGTPVISTELQWTNATSGHRFKSSLCVPFSYTNAGGTAGVVFKIGQTSGSMGTGSAYGWSTIFNATYDAGLRIADISNTFPAATGADTIVCTEGFLRANASGFGMLFAAQAGATTPSISISAGRAFWVLTRVQ